MSIKGPHENPVGRRKGRYCRQLCDRSYDLLILLVTSPLSIQSKNARLLAQRERGSSKTAEQFKDSLEGQDFLETQRLMILT